jgi:DNA polymerase III delta prime subunit
VKEHLKNLHHAYLLEGEREEILPEILEFVKDMEVIQISLDSFKIEDARNLKSYEFLKAGDRKKAFVITVNNFLLEAQNTLLKMLEDPIENTHFFVIVPDAKSLLPTFVSRFYLIRTGSEKSAACHSRAALILLKSCWRKKMRTTCQRIWVGPRQ